MIVKLLTEHHLGFLSLKGGCTGSSKSTLVKMPYRCKSHVVAHPLFNPETHLLLLRLPFCIVAYHPNITVDIDVVQLNESSINVTIDITPEIEEISSYLLEAYYHSDQRGKLREQFKVVSPSENVSTLQ